jgi:uncharacterized protein
VKSKFFLLSLLLLSIGMAWAKEPAYPEYSGFVNDFAGVLSQPERTELEGLCRKLEQKTGAEMAIVSVPSVEPIDTKEYAVKLFEKWGIGKKGKDNGLLILLAMQEKRIEIEVGYGLEGIVNDAKAGEILDKFVIPYFRQGKFGEGLYSGAVEIATLIAQGATSNEGQAAGNVAPQIRIDPWFVAGGVLLIILIMSDSGLSAGLFGALFCAIWGFFLAGIVGAVIGAIMGFVLSYFQFPGGGLFGGGWGGGGFGGGDWGGGGFGGFGGGGSGGGGSGRNW